MNDCFFSSMAASAFPGPHLLSCVLRKEPVLSQDARLPCLNLVLQGHQGSIRGPLTFLTHLNSPTDVTFLLLRSMNGPIWTTSVSLGSVVSKKDYRRISERSEGGKLPVKSRSQRGIRSRNAKCGMMNDELVFYGRLKAYC